MHPVVAKLIANEYASQRSPEWLALRGKMLTASDAATAIGYVWMKKFANSRTDVRQLYSVATPTRLRTS